MDLPEFLLARIAEDEAVARGASPGGWQYGSVESVAGGSLYDETRMIGSLHYEQLSDHDGRIVRHLLSDEANANGAHIARWSSARVLAECDAKRRIVRAHNKWCDGSCGGEGEPSAAYPYHQAHYWSMKALALPYAGHPDYREEWKP